jgi:hypothetical protein
MTSKRSSLGNRSPDLSDAPHSIEHPCHSARLHTLCSTVAENPTLGVGNLFNFAHFFRNISSPRSGKSGCFETARPPGRDFNSDRIRAVGGPNTQAALAAGRPRIAESPSAVPPSSHTPSSPGKSPAWQKLLPATRQNAKMSAIAQITSANAVNVRATLCASNARKASDAAHG